MLGKSCLASNMAMLQSVADVAVGNGPSNFPASCNGVAEHEDTDSLPAHFSPRERPAFETSVSTLEPGPGPEVRKKPKPPPKPKVPGPKVRKVAPGTNKPPIPKKPSVPSAPLQPQAIGKPKRSPPLAAFRFAPVQDSQDLERPQVFEAFVNPPDKPRQPVDDGPGLKHFAPVNHSVAQEHLPKSSTADEVYPSKDTGLTSPDRDSAIEAVPSSFSLGVVLDQRQAQSLPRGTSPRGASPESPHSGRSSPGILTRHGAIRAKRGERLSLTQSLPRSPHSHSYSSMANMRGSDQVSGDSAFSWSADEPGTPKRVMSPNQRSSMERDSLLSPTRLTVRPLITERGSSMASGGSRSNSPARSRSVSPPRDQIDTAEPTLYSSTDESSTYPPEVPERLSSSNASSRVTYEPIPSSSIPYRPASKQSPVDNGGEAGNPERDLEHIRSRAASLARRTDLTDHYAVGQPVVECSRKAFAEAFVKFAGGYKQEEGDVVSMKRMSHSISAAAVHDSTTDSLGRHMRRQTSHDQLTVTESQERVKQLVEKWGGAGQQKPPVAAKPVLHSAPSSVKSRPFSPPACVSNSVGVSTSSSISSVSSSSSSPSSSSSTTTTTTTSSDTLSRSTLDQPEPAKKGATSLTKRFSFRDLASKVSPNIGRRQEKQAAVRNPPVRSKQMSNAKLNLDDSPSLQATSKTTKTDSSTSSTVTSPRAIRATSLTDTLSQDAFLSTNQSKKQRAVSTSDPPTSQCLYSPGKQYRAGSTVELMSTDKPPGIGSAEAKRKEMRHTRYNSVKELTNAALATSPPTERGPLSPGSSTTPIPCTPSPELECLQANSYSNTSSTTSSADALSPDHSKPVVGENAVNYGKQNGKQFIGGLNPPTTSTHGYGEVETADIKPALAASDSGYSTAQERSTSQALSKAAAGNFDHTLSGADPIYDDVPVDAGESTDDDLDDQSNDRTEDIYEDIIFGKVTAPAVPPTPSPADGSISLVAPSDKQRLLWQDLDIVRDSGVLDQLSPSEVKHQEAMFEVLSSEESYNKSLHVVLDHFMPRILPSTTGVNNASGQSDLPTLFIEKSEHHRLFSNISALTKISDNFMQELRSRLLEQVTVETIADIVLKHVTKHFHPYVTYCTNQTYQLQEAKKVIDNPVLKKALTKLESGIGQKLPFSTYLLQPMQRITRLPLLIVTILDYLPEDSPHSVLTQQALQEVQLFVSQCNEGARSMERMEELINLQKKVKFDSKTKPVAFVSQKRYLKRSGNLQQVSGHPGKKGWTKNPEKHKVTLFLFNDLVIIAKLKKKQDYQYQVIDYTSFQLALLEECTVSELPSKVLEAEKKRASSMLNVSTDGGNVGGASVEGSPLRSATPADDDRGHTAFKLVFLENWDGKNKEYILRTDSLTEKTRWLNAFREEDEPSETDGKKSIVYEMWNCPQHVVLFNYTPQQADELALQAGDVVKVLRKMEDDWCHGELMRDGTRGWFPIQFTEEIKNENTRAENLRQRRLLLAEARLKSENLIDL
ncbi:serine-rich adhesin for platelets-like isoform X2 [Sycon ciliatum]|uniref:serine-rich adhesin for platelets-like isoform X2 n=1 Tax=Sycon ciliatum TaxID=27933 RepID=UPI0031F6547D